jgi:16S rRNA (cytosine967-C5)-methyltransferase
LSRKEVSGPKTVIDPAQQRLSGFFKWDVFPLIPAFVRELPGETFSILCGNTGGDSSSKSTCPTVFAQCYPNKRAILEAGGEFLGEADDFAENERTFHNFRCTIHPLPKNSKRGPYEVMEVSVEKRRAVDLVMRIDAEGAYIGSVLAEEAARGEVRAERLAVVERIVRGTQEQKSLLDAVITKHLTRPVKDLPPWIMALLRVSAYQIGWFDSISPKAVVNEAVELVKSGRFRGLAGLVNAVLRRVADQMPRQRSSQKAPENAAEVAEQLSHPQWLVERWIKSFGLTEAIEICRGNNASWGTCIRVNTVRATPHKVVQQLAEDGVEAVAGRYVQDCLWVARLPKDRRIEELRAFRDGLFFIQDESAAVIAQYVGAAAGETVIDLCSAPGGKTCAMAIEMGDQGTIIALDRHPKKLERVRENTNRLGLRCVEPVVGDGTEWSHAPVDRVLVDAPCSGVGVIGRKPDIRWKRSAEDFSELRKLQMALLRNATQLVRPGGVLVYSTCSIDPHENGEIVKWFLSEYPEFVRAPFAPGPLVNQVGELDMAYHRHGIAGGFAAAMRKRESESVTPG